MEKLIYKECGVHWGIRFDARNDALQTLNEELPAPYYAVSFILIPHLWPYHAVKIRSGYTEYIAEHGDWIVFSESYTNKDKMICRVYRHEEFERLFTFYGEAGPPWSKSTHSREDDLDRKIKALTKSIEDLVEYTKGILEAQP